MNNSYLYRQQKDVIPENILKLSKKEAETIVQHKSKDLSKSLTGRLTENLEKIKEKRFKVVNFLRSNNDGSNNVTTPDQIILDVEKDEGNKAENETSSLSDPKSYVYDIYVAQDDFSSVLKDDMIDLNDLSIMDYNDFLYSCPRLTNDAEVELHDDYDEDSNDENHWRNDYPDEDSSDASSMDERAMRRAMASFDLVNELSTSDDEDDHFHKSSKDEFVYSIDAEEYDFGDDYDYTNTGPGSSYERYKKRIIRDLEGISESSTDSDE